MVEPLETTSSGGSVPPAAGYFVEQIVEKPVIAAPDLIRGEQSLLWQAAEYWGLLRHHALGVTPR
jgi:hypothetical protein